MRIRSQIRKNSALLPVQGFGHRLFLVDRIYLSAHRFHFDPGVTDRNQFRSAQRRCRIFLSRYDQKLADLSRHLVLCPCDPGCNRIFRSYLQTAEHRRCLPVPLLIRSSHSFADRVFHPVLRCHFYHICSGSSQFRHIRRFSCRLHRPDCQRITHRRILPFSCHPRLDHIFRIRGKPFKSAAFLPFLLGDPVLLPFKCLHFKSRVCPVHELRYFRSRFRLFCYCPRSFFLWLRLACYCPRSFFLWLRRLLCCYNKCLSRFTSRAAFRSRCPGNDAVFGPRNQVCKCDTVFSIFPLYIRGKCITRIDRVLLSPNRLDSDARTIFRCQYRKDPCHFDRCTFGI